MDSTSSMSSSLNDSKNVSSPQPDKPLDIKVYANAVSFAFQIVYIIIGAVGITGNLLALIVFLGHKPLLKRPANYFLVNQCAINFVVSILLVLTITVDSNRWPASVVVPMCYLWNSRAVFVGLFLSSLYNITLMTVERYLEVVHPIKHHLKISKGKVIASIVISVLLCIVYKLCIGCPLVMVVNGICTSASYASIAANRVVGVANFLIEYFIPVTVIAFCYASMARSLRRHTKITHPSSAEPQPIETKMSRARRNVIKTLFIVVISFVICTTFKQFILMLRFLGDVPLDLSGVTYNVAQVLAYLNSCNDPFIYAFHYEEFRVGLRKLFCRICRAKMVVPMGSRTSHIETQIR